MMGNNKRSRRGLLDGVKIFSVLDESFVDLRSNSNFSEQYTPVEFKWMHQAFEIRYAEQRIEGRKNTPGIQEEMSGYFDR